MKKKLYTLTIIFILFFTGLAEGQGLSFDVNAGMNEALKSINVDTFRKQYGADGTGIKIAVIDTGIDVSTLICKRLPKEGKVIDYIDFTDEGMSIPKALRFLRKTP